MRLAHEDDHHPVDPRRARAAVRASIERRRMQGEFIARGLRSRDEARRTGGFVDADSVIDGLQRKLDAAPTRLAKQGG